MASISSPGIGSGLDIATIVSQLMTVERQPLSLLDRKEAGFQAQLSAYGTVKGALSAFRTAASALATPTKFNTLKATPGDASIATASVSTAASTGAHSIEVLTLAKAQTLKSTTFASTASTVGSGTITVEFGSYTAGAFTANGDRGARTITVPSGANALVSVRDAINEANAGVSASIVNDGTGYRLILSSGTSGTANALRISVDDDDGNDSDASGLSALAYDASTGGTSNLTETIAAKDATLIVDGITITKQQNSADDIIQGVTLNVAAVGTTTLTIARDTSSAQTAVQGFVKAYNDLQTTLKSVAGYDAATKQGGVLLGDVTVRGIQSSLRNAFNSVVTGAGNATTLASVGVAFERDGTLTLDSAKLAAALADPTKNVGAFFASGGKPTDSLVKFVSSNRAAVPGTYPVTVSQLATHGEAVGSTAAATTIVQGVNDVLTLAVDGISRTVTLAAGAYSAATLATELQSKINGAFDNIDGKVAVSQTAGVLKVTSERYGSNSKVVISSGSALTDLFGTPSNTAGVDIAGSIGTFPTTGSGRVLTGGGLSVEVMATVTGSRGTISYSSGFAARLDAALGDLLDSDGMINGRTRGIDASIGDIADRRAVLEQRFVTLEARYRKQFTALDSMMASMNSTSSFLTQQLANLAKISPGNDSGR